MAGNGDGILVWDHNGNGIIDDNTELMSEYNVSGKAVFANGFEKLAHYFDVDNDGVIREQEFQGLRLWVDDGDAKTEEGELQTLQQHGITEIIVPVEGDDFVGDYTKRKEVETTEHGEAQRGQVIAEPEPEPITEPIGDIGQLTIESSIHFVIHPTPSSETVNSIQPQVKAKHQQGNDEVHRSVEENILDGRWLTADDVYRNRNDITNDLEASIKNQLQSVPVRVTNMVLDTLLVDLNGDNTLSIESIIQLAESKQSTGQFDEDFYLASYADVAGAVHKNAFDNGEEHYADFGENEGRNGWYSADKTDFDEVFYLTENPDVAKAIIQGEYRSGAHHFWAVGRMLGLQKNPSNDELLPVIDLDSPYETAEDLPIQSRETTDGNFTLGFRSRGSTVENNLQGLFTGDIYPDAYLDIHHAANKMDQPARRNIKGATGSLVDIAKALEMTALDALQSKESIPSFLSESAHVADGVAEIAESIAGYHKKQNLEEELARSEEVEFLKEFREQWQSQQEDGDDAPMSKMDLFRAVQQANDALGGNNPTSSLLDGLRDILEDDSKSKS